MVVDSIFLKVDIVIGNEELKLAELQEGREITLEKIDTFICINNTPVYKSKLQKKGHIYVAKVLKIFDIREMEKLKEKYCFEV